MINHDKMNMHDRDEKKRFKVEFMRMNNESIEIMKIINQNYNDGRN